MTVQDITGMVRDNLYLIVEVSAPMLIVSLVIGLIISIFQTVTSIHEQTLTFVPKLIGIFLGLILLGHWMLDELSGYMVKLWSDFTLYIK